MSSSDSVRCPFPRLFFSSELAGTCQVSLLRYKARSLVYLLATTMEVAFPASLAAAFEAYVYVVVALPLLGYSLM